MSHEWHATGQLSVPPAWTEPSELQRLAWKSGLTADELREWLRGEVEWRQGAGVGCADPRPPVRRGRAASIT
jgi:hypothetical protein